MLENLLEDVYAGKFGTKNRAELISRLEELKPNGNYLEEFKKSIKAVLALQGIKGIGDDTINLIGNNFKHFIKKVEQETREKALKELE